MAEGQESHSTASFQAVLRTRQVAGGTCQKRRWKGGWACSESSHFLHPSVSVMSFSLQPTVTTRATPASEGHAIPSLLT